MANEGIAILLMIALFVAGAGMAFNLTEHFLGFGLGIGFGNINGISSAIWIIAVKIIGIILMILSVFVVHGIIKESI